MCQFVGHHLDLPSGCHGSSIGDVRMNYLAHLFLADNTDASRIGNLLGDFVRGPVEELAKVYPPELVRGIRMHRAVDQFTDSHTIFREARGLLDTKRKRFAGIIVDVFFDHFLCLRWDRYCAQPLEEFIEDVYRALDRHPEWRAGRLGTAYPVMRHENWLHAYASVEGVGLTLRRIATRSARIAAIIHGEDDLRNNYKAFEQMFHAYMPELLAYVEDWKKKN